MVESFLVQMLNGLPEPFQGKPNIFALLVAYGIQMDHIARTFAEIDYYRDLSNADEARLRQLASLLGVPETFDEIEFLRVAVIGQAFVNNVDACPANMGTITELFDLCYPAVNNEGVFVTVVERLPPKHIRIVASEDRLLIGVPGSGATLTANVLTKMRLVSRLVKEICDPTTSVELISIVQPGGVITPYSFALPATPLADTNYSEMGTGPFPFGVIAT